MTVVSPGNATLTCTADGVPAPNITWTRVIDGMLVQLPETSPDNTVIVSSTETDERTTVSTVSFFFTVTFFAAEYTCRASNLLGTDAQAAVLTIHGEIFLFLEMFITFIRSFLTHFSMVIFILSFTVVPVILEPEEGTVITVDQSSTAMFDCSAAGVPLPAISWVRVYDNGTTEELTMERNPRVMLLDTDIDSGYDLEDRGIVTQVNRTLNLTYTQDNDSGTYCCIASNEAGNDTQEFELVVQGM